MNDDAFYADEGAIVTDIAQRHYVAVHPGYAMTPQRYRGALAARFTVFALSLISLVLSVVGSVVPYFSTMSTTYSSTRRYYYSLWQEWEGTATDKWYANSWIGLATIMIIVSWVFLLIGVVLAGVLAGTLPRAERERLEDKANSEMAMAKYGHLRQEYGDTDDSDTFPYTNVRMMNRGQVCEVPYETRELVRRRYDRCLCAATLSMLIVADIFAVTTVSVMGADYSDRSGYSWYGYYYYSYFLSSGKVQAGIPLMALAAVLLFIAFILVAIPQITGVPLCGNLHPARCVLMVLDDSTAQDVNDQLRRFLRVDGQVPRHAAQGVRVALPGPALADLTNANQQYYTARFVGEGDSGVPATTPGGYTTSTYHTVAGQPVTVAKGKERAEPEVFVAREGTEDRSDRSGAADHAWRRE